MIHTNVQLNKILCGCVKARVRNWEKQAGVRAIFKVANTKHPSPLFRPLSKATQNSVLALAQKSA